MTSNQHCFQSDRAGDDGEFRPNRIMALAPAADLNQPHGRERLGRARAA